ncbi:MAG TPA: type II toxin-antitoxin system VapB family antitoxin [Vicinamibacterales bacterium]|nr:type II toxin-antitoxin system VapB family antitoxin [Vicinamibacterales bacterium]
MRTTLDIDDDVLQAAKELAELHRKSAGEVVSELLRKALQPAPSTQRVRNGVPLLTRRPGAPPTTMAMVNELRDEE